MGTDFQFSCKADFTLRLRPFKLIVTVSYHKPLWVLVEKFLWLKRISKHKNANQRIDLLGI